MEGDASAIRAECERAAGGDWGKWERQTAAYRDALKARIDALPGQGAYMGAPLPALDGPLFQPALRAQLGHVTNPGDWDAFRKAGILLAANRWLKERGIDLVFVCVPSMPEIYIEHFLDKVPADGVVAPHVRRALLELLERDIEVVDAYRSMRDARDGEFQFLPGDHHWNQVGMAATVRDVAARLSRYQFGKDASRAAPVTKTTAGPYVLPPTGTAEEWRPIPNTLTESQWAAARQTLPRSMDFITAADGSKLADDPRSPVCLVGNSFAMYFQEMLIREANLQIRSRWGSGQTVEAFPGFLREPETLEGVRVLVWVTSYDAISSFRRLPEPIMPSLGPR
jgi:hypothetical protein